MWHSEDDIVKDLAILNDFGISDDQESYTFLNSIGRGSKIREKSKISTNFIDSRTGELINVDDGVLDIETFHKSKGRGSILSSYLRKKSQLQQQLRLARPLGSGDEAIESYCRRNFLLNKSKNSAKTLDCEPDTIAQTTTDLRFDKTKKRIKATRNSKLQSNALISNLLSKTKANPEANINSDNYDYGYNNYDIKLKQKSSGNDSAASERDEKNDFSERSDDSYNKIQIIKNIVGNERFITIDNNEGEIKDKKEYKINNDIYKTGSFFEEAEQEEKRDQIYKKCGKKSLKILFSESINGLKEITDTEPEVFNDSVAKAFVINHDDFPPLQQN